MIFYPSALRAIPATVPRAVGMVSQIMPKSSESGSKMEAKPSKKGQKSSKFEVVGGPGQSRDGAGGHLGPNWDENAGCNEKRSKTGVILEERTCNVPTPAQSKHSFRD